MNKKIIGLFIFFAILFSMPQLLRLVMYDQSMIGTTTYFHTRMAEMVLSGELYDQLSFGGRPYTYPPGYHYLLAFMMPAAYFVNPLIGAAGIVVLYFLSREMGFSEESSLFSSALLGFIPGYVYLSGHINPRLPALVFLSLAILFLMRSEREWICKYLSTLALFLAYLMHPLVGAVGTAFILILFRKSLKRALRVSFFSLAFFLAWQIPVLMYVSVPEPGAFYEVYVELMTGVQFFIFESGLVSDSITVLMLVLAAYGFLKVRQKRFAKEWALLAFAFPLVFGNRINEQLLFPVAILAGDAFISHWREFLQKVYLGFVPIKAMTALFMVYVAMGGLVAAGSLLYFPPTPEQYDSMLWIRDNTECGSTVMADWFYGHWITSVAKRRDVIDAYAEYAPEMDQRYLDSQKILSGSNVAETMRLLDKYGVSYVYYNKPEDMRFCSGFAYATREPYFEKAHENGNSFVYRVHYGGGATPDPIC